MKFLITGGAGFIGSRTALALAQAGMDVTVVDNLNPQIHGAGANFRRLWLGPSDASGGMFAIEG